MVMPASASSTPRHWQSRGLSAILLLPVAVLFAAVTALRRLAYCSGLLRREHAGVPVIVVGNITAGGTGKTPLVLWLAQFLAVRGRQPGIISRGYGAARTDPRAVPANGAARDYGDEPCLLARRAGCPVWVGADRAATVHALRTAHPEVDVIISDDGLQHYRLVRDIEIAVIDGACGYGNGWPLPAGPLREPVSRLDKIDAVIINGDDQHGIRHPQAMTMHLNGSTFHKLLNPAHTADATHFSGQKIHAVAGIGIGNPQRFFDHLQQLGVQCTTHAFPDHHVFRPQDIDFDDADSILMTEKDAVKCEPFATGRHWALAVSAEPDTQLGELVTTRLTKTAHHG